MARNTSNNELLLNITHPLLAPTLSLTTRAGFTKIKVIY